ncbi:hypothetical protein STAS_19225, partial [Striga asiatica]
MKVKINSCSVDELDSVDPGLLWKIAELEKKRKTRNPRKNNLLVEVPESKKFLDIATMPMILTYDDSTEQESIERTIKETPGLGRVRMLTREEWDAIQEVRPRTPFESKIARPNAKIQTGEPLHRRRQELTVGFLAGRGREAATDCRSCCDSEMGVMTRRSYLQRGGRRWW